MAPQHPTDIDGFYFKHPSFIWGPLLLSASVRALSTVPPVAEHLAKLNAQRYGIVDAALYIVFAITLAYAVHGWMVCHLGQEGQLQSYDRKGEGASKPKKYSEKMPPAHEAVRTIAALLTSLVYAVFPFAPATTTWSSFLGWHFLLALYWDLHFYVCHRVAHESRSAYAFFHKLHHENKQPGPFNAYFVTYQSHVLLEQIVVLIMALCGLPRDVFTFTLWHGTLGTFIEHAGHDMDNIKLPIIGKLGVTWGALSTALAPWSLLLGGESTAEHDWHHEKFTTNYALSFTYLDKLLGTYHPGRKPGEAIKPKDKLEPKPFCYSESENLEPIDGPVYRMLPGKMKDAEYEECDAPRAPCFCSGLEFD